MEQPEVQISQNRFATYCSGSCSVQSKAYMSSKLLLVLLPQSMVLLALNVHKIQCGGQTEKKPSQKGSGRTIFGEQL